MQKFQAESAYQILQIQFPSLSFKRRLKTKKLTHILWKRVRKFIKNFVLYNLISQIL